MTKPRTENGVIVRCVQDAPSQLSGLYQQRFYIHLNTDLLRAGDRIVPCNAFIREQVGEGIVSRNPDEYTLVVQERPEASGVGYLYQVSHTFEDKNAYYPHKLISKDSLFEYVGSQMPSLKHWDMWIMNYVKFN